MKRIALMFALFFVVALIFPANAPAPNCGDNVVNRIEEECDGTDPGVCGDLPCTEECLCGPVCGDGTKDPDEECDGDDAEACGDMPCTDKCICEEEPPGNCYPRTQGFWKRVCAGVYGPGGLPPTKKEHPETPDGFSSETLCSEFNRLFRSDPCVRAASQIAALELNLAYNGFLDSTCEIEYDGETMTAAEALALAKSLDCKDAGDLAEAINSGDAL